MFSLCPSLSLTPSLLSPFSIFSFQRLKKKKVLANPCLPDLEEGSMEEEEGEEEESSGAGEKKEEEEKKKKPAAITRRRSRRGARALTARKSTSGPSASSPTNW